MVDYIADAQKNLLDFKAHGSVHLISLQKYLETELKGNVSKVELGDTSLTFQMLTLDFKVVLESFINPPHDFLTKGFLIAYLVTKDINGLISEIYLNGLEFDKTGNLGLKYSTNDFAEEFFKGIVIAIAAQPRTVTI